MELSAATNNEGYARALMRTWQNSGLKLNSTPSKSSLSEARSKVSYQFFEDIFREDLAKRTHERKTFRGFHLYAIDGDQFDLPASGDVVSYGYVGFQLARDKETHFPKMYTAQALDILSGEMREFAFSNRQDEVHLARGMTKALEPNSISVYDRLHSGYETFLSHHEANNYFIVRARTMASAGKSEIRSGTGVHADVRSFTESNARSKKIIWRAAPGQRRRKRIGLEIRLVKVRNPKTNQTYVFCTNLPEETFSAKTIGKLYRKRWEIETAFKDLTSTLKLGQFHSKKLNGILQEIFALLWLANSVKRQMQSQIKSDPENILRRRYQKANFKLSVSCVVDAIGFLVQKRWRKFLELVNYLIHRTIENRLRDSRSYERCVKHRGREYKQRNLVPRRRR